MSYIYLINNSTNKKLAIIISINFKFTNQQPEYITIREYYQSNSHIYQIIMYPHSDIMVLIIIVIIIHFAINFRAIYVSFEIVG